MLSTIVQVKIISNQVSSCTHIKIIIYFTSITDLQSPFFMDGTLKKRKSDPSYRLFLHWIAVQTRGYHSECSPRVVPLRRNILMAAFNQPQLFQATHDAVDGALHRRRHRLGLMAAPIQRRELFVLLGIPRKPLMRVPRLRIKTSTKN